MLVYSGFQAPWDYCFNICDRETPEEARSKCVSASENNLWEDVRKRWKSWLPLTRDNTRKTDPSVSSCQSYFPIVRSG